MFDEVSVDGLSIIDLHLLCEKVGVHGRTKYHTLIEEHAFNRIVSDRQLQGACREIIKNGGKLLELYVELSENEEVIGDDDLRDDDSSCD